METAWLIESHHNGLRYLAIDEAGVAYWTRDHDKAVRAARRADAEAIARLSGLEITIVVEHQWGW